jgi:hypothetical protein
MKGYSLERFATLLLVGTSTIDTCAFVLTWCLGLQGLEGVGLLHCDISSGNLLLGNEGETPRDRGVLVDLDLAFPATELSEERNYSCVCIVAFVPFAAR